MNFLYKDSDKAIKHWTEFVPFAIPNFLDNTLGVPPSTNMIKNEWINWDKKKNNKKIMNNSLMILYTKIKYIQIKKYGKS